MRGLLLATLLAGAALNARAAAPSIEVHSIATEFATFWDATQNLAPAERIAAFNQQVAPKFPAFYGVARYQGQRTQAEQDKMIGAALASFGRQRAAYLDKVAHFEADLPRHIASFTATFPDFRPSVETWFVHSLGEMDGGTREFNGRNYLIFGADMMVAVHGSGDESAFFHHELFHIHHDSVAPECAGQGMWQPLWREGLATYVSKVMNPAASEREMLLEFPPDTLHITKTHLRASLADLEKVLDNSDEKYLAPLFNTAADDTGLAPRRGYYLGYLVAAEIGKTHSLRDMSKLSCSAARPLVIDTVRKLQRSL